MKLRSCNENFHFGQKFGFTILSLTLYIGKKKKKKEHQIVSALVCTHDCILDKKFKFTTVSPRAKSTSHRYRSLLTRLRGDDALQCRKSFSLRNSGNLESNDRSARQFHPCREKDSGCPLHILSDNRFHAVTYVRLFFFLSAY